MALRPQTYTKGNTVEKHINTAYDIVKEVADNIDSILKVSDDAALADLAVVAADIVNVNLVGTDIANGKIDAAIEAVFLTALNVLATNADVAITNADVVQTALDVISTGADSIQTALDVIITNADVVLTNADVVSTNNDVGLTNADVLITNNDVVLTSADVNTTNADVVTTNADAVTTNGDVITTAASVVEADHWANYPENTLVPEGNLSDEYSAFHWMKKAQAIAVGALTYQGDWDASGSVYPGAPELGFFYKISVAGTISGTNFAISDSIIYNGTDWDKLDNTEQVTSVAGLIGSITASALRTALNVEDGATADQSAAEVKTLLSDVITFDGSNNASFVGDVSLDDNKHLYLGAGNDLDIFHDGTNGRFYNATGDMLFIEQVNSGTIAHRIYNAGGASHYAMIMGGAVTKVALYYDNALQLTTASGGAILNASPATSDDSLKIPTTAFVKNVTGGLNTKVIDIGDWDMDADTFAQVAHGLTLSKIRSISALIRRDDDLFRYDFMAFNSSGTGAHYINASSTNVSLFRHTSGTFDSTNYNATAFNRGWITIQYID